MEKESDDGPTNKQTDRISSCILDPFCRRGRVKSAELATEYLCLYFKRNKTKLVLDRSAR